MKPTLSFLLAFPALLACNAVSTGELGQLAFDDLETNQSPTSGAYVVGDIVLLRVGQAEGSTEPLEGLTVLSDGVVFSFASAPEPGPTLRGTALSAGSGVLQIMRGDTLVDQITLEAGALDAVALVTPDLFTETSTSEAGFSQIDLLEDGAVTLFVQPQELIGEGRRALKGHLAANVLVEDSSLLIASPPEGSFFRLGGNLVLTAQAPGQTTLSLSRGAQSFSLPLEVVSLDEVTMSASHTDGLLVGDATKADGASVLGDRYRFTNICLPQVVSCADIEIESFTDDLAIITEVRRGGTALVEAALIDREGDTLQSQLLSFLVPAP